jgi:hypothetical protein
MAALQTGALAPGPDVTNKQTRHEDYEFTNVSKMIYKLKDEG